VAHGARGDDAHAHLVVFTFSGESLGAARSFSLEGRATGGQSDTSLQADAMPSIVRTAI
jgi:hypothetical protein